jgi:hypothetical protein
MADFSRSWPSKGKKIRRTSCGFRQACRDRAPCAVALNGRLGYPVVLIIVAAVLLYFLGALAALDTTWLRASAVPPLIGRHVPCPAVFPPGVKCNSQKSIPASDLDMPRARAALRWEADGLCCAWSDAYRFIYIRTGKAASTTVLSAFLRPAICPIRPGERGVVAPRDSAGGAYLFGANCSADRFEPLESDCAPCASLPRWKWLHYFVFSTVRNPFLRAASSYAFCVRNTSQTPFSAFCVNPDVAGACPWLPIHPDVPPDAPPAANAHWGQQVSGLCSQAPPGGCIVDWVARVENLNADLDVAVASINAMRLPGYPPLPLYSARPRRANHKEGGSASGLSKAAQLYAAPANAHCAAAVAAWYASDFERFGYSPTELPTA